LQAVIDHLRGQGELEGTVRLERQPGLGQPLTLFIDGAVQKGSVDCLSFPLPIKDVSGHFSGGGDDWEFSEFIGRRGSGGARCRGGFHPDPAGRPELELDFSMVGAAFDTPLYSALCQECQAVWKEFRPKGGLNVAGKLLWSTAT